MLLFLLGALGCAHHGPLAGEPPGNAGAPPAGGDEATRSGQTVDVADEPAAPRADLREIRKAGVLRVLVHEAESLRGGGSPVDRELALVGLFAQSLGLAVRYVAVRDFSQLIDALLEGRGDLIASQLARTPSRSQRVLFASPVRYVSELVVSGTKAANPPSKLEDLRGRQIWLQPSTSYVETLYEARTKIGGAFRIVPVGEEVDGHTMLDRVAEGRYALSVLDSDDVEGYLAYRDDVRVCFPLKRNVPIAWAVRPGARDLVTEIDTFVAENVTVTRGRRVYRGDLDELRKLGILRVVLPNNAASYFHYRGLPMGFQYELATRLARRLGLRLQVVVPRKQSDMLPLVRGGHADLVAATVTITRERRALVDFSQPLASVSEVLVQRAGDTPITSVEQLAGRAVHVRRGSSYWRTLEALKATVPTLELVEAPPSSETETLIDRVGSGAIPLTVADYNILGAGITFRQDVAATLTLSRGQQVAFAMRKGSPLLKAAVDQLVGVERSRARKPGPRAGRPGDDPSTLPVETLPEGALSRYDALARRFGEEYGVDWRLVVALMKHESGFDPSHESLVGAKGLMQVMPHVARRMSLGDRDLADPEHGIHAGVRYLAELMDRFDPGMGPALQARFAIAAYRVGYEHVVDARRLAKRQSLDPNRWHGHVARAIRMLESARHAAEARYGYCAGSDAARYVAAVEATWAGYRERVPDQGR